MTNNSIPHEDQLRARLGAVVSALHYACLRQHAFAHISIGVLVGVMIAIPCVLISRFGTMPVPLSITEVTLACIAVPTGLALLFALRRAPTKMQVAISADRLLNLQEQISTAWDYANRQPHSPLTSTLAKHALATRLPRRVADVFPVELGIVFKLVPVAGLLLLIAVIIDLPAQSVTPVPNRSASTTHDSTVINEGEYLREFAHQLRARANREALYRSQEQARALEALGTRMQDGSVTRRQALAQLRQMHTQLEAARRDALSQGTSTEEVTITPDSQQGGNSNQSSRYELEAMLRSVTQGSAPTQSTDALLSAADAAAQLGISEADLLAALREHQSGDAKALQNLIDRAGEAARSRDDASALEQAQDEVARSRSELGDRLAQLRRNGRTGTQQPGAARNDNPVDDEANTESGDNHSSAGRSSDGGAGIGQDDASGSPNKRTNKRGIRIATQAIRPMPLPGVGKVFSATTQTLPQQNTSAIETIEVNPAYKQELERIQIVDDIPAHRKAFVRNYFLSLSRATSTPRGETLTETKR